MSNKRGMEHQGGGERYGGRPDEHIEVVGNGPSDPPRQATAAQLAKRKIASMKGRTSGRNSRQGSPATGAPPVNAFAQNQTFQPPQSTGGGFNFSFGQSPSFGQQPEQQQDQNGGNPFGNNQNNSTPIFGAGGAAPPRLNTVSIFAAQRQAEMGLDTFGPQKDMLGSAQDDSITVGILEEFAHLDAIDRQNELLNAKPQNDTKSVFFQPSAKPGSFLSPQKPQNATQNVVFKPSAKPGTFLSPQKPQNDTKHVVFQQSAKPGTFLSPQKTAPRRKAVPQNIVMTQPAPPQQPVIQPQPAFQQQAPFFQQPVVQQQSAFEQQPAFQQTVFPQQPVFPQQHAFQQQPVLPQQPVPPQQSDWPSSFFPNNHTMNPDMNTHWATPFANDEFTRQMQNGDSSNQWGQQNNSATSNTPTPSFSFGATQPQQSAPTPSSSSFSFGATQPQPSAAAPSSFSFGATQPQQPAQSTPSFSFGATQPQQPTQPTASFSFGASQDTAKASTPSFSGFGQNTQTTQDTAQASNSSFGGFGQQNGTTTPSFGGFGQNAQSTQDNARANTPSFGGFGQNTQQNGSNTPSFFGASPAATPEPSTPGESVFNSVANKSNGIKPGMFTPTQQNGEETPKPATFSFGNTNGAQTPSQPSTFSFGQSQTAQPTPSSNNVFGGFGKTNETPKFSFGAPKGDDHNMDKSEEPAAPATEAPSTAGRSLFDRMPPASSAEPETSSTAGKSLFERMTPTDPPATEPRPSFAPSSSLFGAKPVDQTPSNPSKSFFEPPATAPKPTTSLFQSNKETDATPKPTASLFQFNKETDAAPTPKPATSLFQPSKDKEAAPAAKPLFAPATPPPAKSVSPPAPQASLFAPAAASKPEASAASASGPDTFKALNEGLIAHLKGQDTSKDWTPIFAYYMKQATNVTNEGEQTPKPSAPVNYFAPQQSAPAVPPVFSSQVTPKAPAPSNMFKHAQTPAVGSSLRNQITQSPPATAPVSRKRSADDELTKDSDSFRPPATEKRARPNEPVAYPKLPDTASNTAKLFQSTLEKSTSDAPKFGPPADVVAKVREDAAKKAGAEKSSSSPFSFQPNASSSSGAGPVGFKPTFGGASSGAGNAFASFAEKAKAKEEEERKKRKDEDYDSDEDEAEWEAKDKAAQEEKARKIREAAQKAPGFIFNPSSGNDKHGSKAAPAFTLKPATEDGLSAFAKKAKATEEQERKKRKDEDYDSDDDEAEWEAKDKAAQEEKARKIREAAQKAPGFVFNAPAGAKSTTSIFAQTPTKPASTSSNIFGQSKSTDAESSADKAEAEKEQGTGDHTWKPNTPIKFGASTAGQGSTTPAAPPPANPFGGLFGSKTMTPATDKGKLGLPSKVGFNFGPATNSSLATSRATTPGLTTDGEASTAGDDESEEPSDQPKEAQIEDMTALLPEEKEGNEVIFEADMCKVSKFDEKKTEDGMKPAWVEKGKGPVYVLKDKTTGKVRILVKVAPLGRLAMNFSPLKGSTYNVKSKKTVMGAFMDHLDKTPSKQGKLSSWTILLREPTLAEKLAQALTDGRPE